MKPGKIMAIIVTIILAISILTSLFTGNEESNDLTPEPQEKTFSEMSKKEQGQLMLEGIGDLLESASNKKGTTGFVAKKMKLDIDILRDPDSFMEHPEKLERNMHKNLQKNMVKNMDKNKN